MIESDHAVAGVMNLKLRGTLPLVEGARLLALKAGIPATASLARSTVSVVAPTDRGLPGGCEVDDWVPASPWGAPLPGEDGSVLDRHGRALRKKREHWMRGVAQQGRCAATPAVQGRSIIERPFQPLVGLGRAWEIVQKQIA